MILICTEYERPVAKTWDAGNTADPQSEVAPWQQLPARDCRWPPRPAETADRRRQRMIRDTERYLNDPASEAWTRLPRARPPVAAPRLADCKTYVGLGLRGRAQTTLLFHTEWFCCMGRQPVLHDEENQSEEVALAAASW